MDLFSKEELDKFLAKRYPGASFVGQPVGLDNYARLMHADERRLELARKLREVVAVMRATGDVAGSKELREEINDALMRRPTWRERAMDRNLNSNRR